MINRNLSKPFDNRASLDHSRLENKCENWGDYSLDDVYLNGYSTCVLRFVEEEF